MLDSVQLQRVFGSAEGCHGSLQLALNPLQQDFREAYINEKLLQRWRRGEAWATVDLQGIALSERCCDTTLVSMPPAYRQPVQQLTGLPVHQQMCSAHGWCTDVLAYRASSTVRVSCVPQGHVSVQSAMLSIARPLCCQLAACLHSAQCA